MQPCSIIVFSARDVSAESFVATSIHTGCRLEAVDCGERRAHRLDDTLPLPSPFAFALRFAAMCPVAARSAGRHLCCPRCSSSRAPRCCAAWARALPTERSASSSALRSRRENSTRSGPANEHHFRWPRRTPLAPGRAVNVCGGWRRQLGRARCCAGT